MRITTKVAGVMLWTAALFTATTLLAQEELPSPPPVAKPATPATPAPKAAAPKSTAQKTTAPKTTARRATTPNAAAPRPIGPPIPFPPGPPPIVIGPFAPPPILSMRRDLPPDVRARRERLRALSAQALDAFLPPDGGGPVGPDGARFGAAAAAILGDGLIETLTVKLDPAGTNLKEDKVKFDTVATMRRSPWAPEPSKLSSQMNIKIGPNEAGAAAAAIDGKLRFQTQTVPLVNYALAQYKIRAAEEASKTHDGPPTSEDVLKSRINAKLQTVDAILSIDEVADLMNQLAEIRLSFVNEEIEGLRAALSKAPDDEARKDASAALTAARVKRDRLLEVRSKTVRGKDGAAESISLKLAMLDLIPGADMKTFDVTLSNNEITATLAGDVYQYVELYPLAKPLLIGTLERIQAGDVQAVETMRRAINVYLSQGLKPLLPEAQGAELTPAPAPPAPAPPAAEAPAPAPQPEALPSP